MASCDISSIGLAARHPQQLFSVGVAGVLKRYLTAAQIGTLTVTLPSGLTVHHRGTLPGPEAVLNIRRWRTLRRMMLAGALGLRARLHGRRLPQSGYSGIVGFRHAKRSGAR